jgi:hypothetical protein
MDAEGMRGWAMGYVKEGLVSKMTARLTTDENGQGGRPRLKKREGMGKGTIEVGRRRMPRIDRELDRRLDGSRISIFEAGKRGWSCPRWGCHRSGGARYRIAPAGQIGPDPLEETPTYLVGIQAVPAPSTGEPQWQSRPAPGCLAGVQSLFRL